WYQWSYSAKAAAADGLQNLAGLMRAQAEPPRQAAIATPTAKAPATVPEILSRVQEIASNDDVVLESVVPNATDKNQLDLAATGQFRDAMRFLARLETLPVEPAGFDLAPSADGGVALTVNVIQNGKPAAPTTFADYIDAVSLYSAVRDPFAVGDPVTLPNTGADLGDLSWSYHLTSISLLGAVRVATIDGKDYEVGDVLNGMAITAIDPSSVSLQGSGKFPLQKIHFRHNPGGR
ncbi:MAG: hypothetical protein JO256_08555, partial [Alphaproteobacteria bacterium]|nr:hypothetical protein [Alphaproteobacteria bacterium]